MTVARWLRENWAYLLGGAGVGGVALLAIVARPTIGSAPASPPLPPGASSRVWLLLEGSAVELHEGARYRGCVSVPWVVPTSSVVSRIGPGLTARGFRDIVVTRARPSDWPAVKCAVFVEATWGKAAEALARPGHVDFAWESRSG